MLQSMECEYEVGMVAALLGENKEGDDTDSGLFGMSRHVRENNHVANIIYEYCGKLDLLAYLFLTESLLLFVAYMWLFALFKFYIYDVTWIRKVFL